MQKGLINSRHIAAILMIFVFALTSIGRHQWPSYLFSLAGLSIVIAPLTCQVRNWRQQGSLLRGFVIGLLITILIVWAYVLAQIFNLSLVTTVIDAVFSRGRHGEFLGIIRPRAAFAEPAHLAMYLSFSYVVLDILDKNEARIRMLKTVTLATILIVGSLTGIMLMIVYIPVRWLTNKLFSRANLNYKQVLYDIFFLCFLLMLFIFYFETLVHYALPYLNRAEDMYSVIISRDFTGSVGTRSNAIRALPIYWSDKGLIGFLFGTGYGNYENWLIQNFSHMGSRVAMARGDINNLIAVVWLSTGLFGFAAYAYFFKRIFTLSVHKSLYLPVLVFVILVQFATGSLIAYNYWFLLFIVITVMNFISKRSTKEVPR